MIRRVLAAGVFAGLVAGCSDGPSGPTPPTSLSITAKERFVLSGDTVRVPISTEGGSAEGVVWESLDPQVATVQNGLVTAVTHGNARIVARAGAISDTARVFVLRNNFLTNANDACTVAEPTRVNVRIAAVSQHAIVLADVNNPAGGFTDAEYRQIAEQFDQQVHPTVTGAFGAPLDIDGNGRVIILYTRAVNELTPVGSTSFVGGFFFARDFFPRTARQVLGRQLGACAGSNEAEMFYMLAPDPARGGPFSKARVQQSTISVVAHEYQHLINASRRLFALGTGNFVEEVWLNEGLSHIAEELMFYATSGLGPRQNIGVQQLGPQNAQNAFFTYQVSNFGRLAEYLEDTPAHSPFASGGEPDAGNLLETRGAIWQFLRYAADRRGGNDTALWNALVNTSELGMENLRNRLATDPLPWFRDWAVALYADDAGIPVPARFTNPSWNFRSIFPAFQDGGGQQIYPTYPLATRALANGVPIDLPIRAGSAAYVRFGVAPGTSAAVAVGAGAAPVLPTCPGGTAVNLGVGEVYTGPAGAGEALCVAGGAAGAEFAMVPFHGSLGQGFLAVSILGAGVVPVLGPPNPSRAGTAFSLRSRTATTEAGHELRHDHGWHLHLQEIARRELAPLVPGAAPELRPNAAAASTAATGPLLISIVRTR